MPVAALRPLHLAKSVEALNKKVEPIGNFSSSNVKVLSKHANETFSKAETKRTEGDEEGSYILYMRFCSLVQTVRKSADYKKNKAFLDDIMGAKRCESALKWAEQLSESLEARYEILKGEEKTRDILKTKEAESRLQLVEKATEFAAGQIQACPISIDKESIVGIITSRHLFEILQGREPDIIIFDTRPRRDYDESHIKHSLCVSVPEEIIKPGLSALKLEDKLPAESLALWKKRAQVNYVVLLDWHYTGSPYNYDDPIAILKKALFIWDVTVRLKHEPVFLEGGYSDWLLRYPTITTNSRVNIPPPSPLIQSESSQVKDVNQVIISSFDYPFEFLEEKTPETKTSDVSSPPSGDSSMTNGSDTDSPYRGGSQNTGPRLKQAVVLDRSTKPKYMAKPADKVVNGGTLSPEPMPMIESPKKPVINRQLKPQLTADEKAQQRQLETGLSKENQLADLDLQLQKERVEHEKEFQMLRLRKEKEAEESKRVELQKQEEVLTEAIKKLELSVEENGKEKADLKRENEQLKAELEKNSVEFEEFNKWKEEMQKLKRKEERMKELHEQVELMRRERKEKTNLHEAKKTTNSAEASTGSPVAKITDRDADSPTTTNNATSTTYEKLKDDDDDFLSPSLDTSAKKGLSRSYSSPNIAQLVQDSDYRWQSSSSTTPSFNRSNKPPVMTSLAAVDWGSCRPRSKIGLRNLGNTCYMNATLQCLASTVPLAQYLLNRKHLEQARPFGAKRTAEIGEGFVNVVKHLWLGNAKWFTPKEFRNTVGRCHAPFAGSIQQDSHEFLLLLMAGIAEYLNKNQGARAIQADRLDETNCPDPVAADRVWNAQKKLENSMILDLFYGQSRSTLKCMHCGTVSATFDNFNCLSLPIPVKNSGRCTLTDCLEVYLKEEMMTGTSMWNCPRCKEPRDAIKKLDIWKLPPILIVHLKRFIYGDIWREKIQTNVDFSINDLELRNYVVGPPGDSNFNLYAVSNHYGTMEGGHYVALCKILNQWIKFDDQDVYDMHSSEVKTSAGYLLFYSSQKLG